MQRDRDLAGPEIGPEMATDLTDRLDDVLTDLLGDRLKLLVAESVEVRRAVDAI
jgi:hypothetical protein